MNELNENDDIKNINNYIYNMGLDKNLKKQVLNYYSKYDLIMIIDEIRNNRMKKGNYKELYPNMNKKNCIKWIIKNDKYISVFK
jgi:hypothetical protein